MTKDEMIKEIGQAMCKVKCKYCEDCFHLRMAEDIYNVGYRKVADDEIVVKKSGYEKLSKDYSTINNEAYYCGFSAGVEEAKQETEYWKSRCKEIGDVASKETAREIFQELKSISESNGVFIWQHTFDFDQLAKEKDIELED